MSAQHDNDVKTFLATAAGAQSNYSQSVYQPKETEKPEDQPDDEHKEAAFNEMHGLLNEQDLAHAQGSRAWFSHAAVDVEGRDTPDLLRHSMRWNWFDDV